MIQDESGAIAALWVESGLCGTLRFAFFDLKRRIDARDAKTAFTPRSWAYRLAARSTADSFSIPPVSTSAPASDAYAFFEGIFIWNIAIQFSLQRSKVLSMRFRTLVSRPAIRNFDPATRRASPAARPKRYCSTSPESWELSGRENDGISAWVVPQNGQIPRRISMRRSR